MPVPSDVQILIAGVDRTQDILYPSARFEAQANAGVGTCAVVVKDTARNLSFTTGNEIQLNLDAQPYFGGWLMQKGLQFAFPVVDTTTLANVTARQHALRGVDYNILFDRLMTNNPADYYSILPIQPPGSIAGDLVTDLTNNYIDVPVGFDLTTYVDDVGVADPDGEFLWHQQGTSFRRQMQLVSGKNAAIYYFDAQKRLHYHSPEGSYARWGFSDRPNNRTVMSTDVGFNGATYGFRELDTVEDITGMINDVMIWGGSEWQGTGGTVFARSTNSTSISQHGLWQDAQVLFGADHAKSQEQVDAIANAIVQGPGDPYVTPGVDEAGMVRNRSVPAWTLKLAWYAHDVPLLDGSGARDHLVPGQIVNIVLWVHGTGPTNPLILTLPLRQVAITFPTIPSNTGGASKTYVRFEGTFGLSVDDPVSLWRVLLDRRAEVQRTVLATADPSSTTVIPGALWQGDPDEECDGSRRVFTLSANGNPVVFIGGTSEVYVNGLRMRQGADYQELPNSGQIQLFQAPAVNSSIWAYVRLVG